MAVSISSKTPAVKDNIKCEPVGQALAVVDSEDLLVIVNVSPDER